MFDVISIHSGEDLVISAQRWKRPISSSITSLSSNLVLCWAWLPAISVQVC